VTRLFSRATDRARCRERRESEEKRAMLAGTKYVWLKRGSNLTERQLAKRAELDPARSQLRAAGVLQMAEAMCGHGRGWRLLRGCRRHRDGGQGDHQAGTGLLRLERRPDGPGHVLDEGHIKG
jgi:ferric-dicitrate binding protein FerR (iron transport regulator)